MHYTELRSHNIFEGFFRSYYNGTLEIRVEDIPHIKGQIVGHQSLQGDGDPILGQGHEFCDHHNMVCDAIINRG